MLPGPRTKPFPISPPSSQANAAATTFFEKLSRGFRCFYGSDEHQCGDVPTLAVVYILAYSGTTVFSVLLIRYAEGAVFTVVVLALVTPLVTLFWMFFESLPQIHFDPRFDLAMVFVLIGVVVMMPAVIMYAYLSNGGCSGIDSGKEEQVQRNDNNPPDTGTPVLQPPPLGKRKRTQSASSLRANRPTKKHLKKSASTGKLPRIRSATAISF